MFSILLSIGLIFYGFPVSESLDVIALKKAIETKNENGIINILCYRPNFQRKFIMSTYFYKYRKDLHTELENILSSHFANLILNLIKDPAEYDAMEIERISDYHFTMDPEKWGAAEILVLRTHQEIEEMKKIYNAGKFMNVIKNVDRTYGLLTDLVRNKQKSESSKDLNKTSAQIDAEKLCEAGYNFFDEDVFVEVFTTNNLEQLKLIFEKFPDTKCKTTIEELIEKKFSNTALASFKTVAQISNDRIGYFADRLKHVITGCWIVNSFYEDLTRIIITRSEIDLRAIQKEFDRRDGDDALVKLIQKKTSGSYRDALLALIKGNQSKKIIS
ncbi:unnamed protein product [Caenorhabditis angaria]|uniref:Annexin n=1 Tax=Caenorhabditis angaria TaxID=860376 RepID=A0A9P1ILU2_9PELO|nr:unnamed protein product [Caenorhabditis angaria]